MKCFLQTTCLIVLLVACDKKALFTESFNSHNLGVSLVAVSKHSAMQHRIRADPNMNQVMSMITTDPHEEGNQVLKVKGEGVFDLLIDEYPKQVKSFEVVFTIRTIDENEVGYVHLENLQGYAAVGLDFSKQQVGIHGSDDKPVQFAKGEKLTFHVQVNTDQKHYNLEMRKGDDNKVAIVSEAAFLDEDFDYLNKLKFTMNGHYLIDDVSLHALD